MEFEKGIHDPKSCSYPNKSKPSKQSGCKRHAILIDFKDLRGVQTFFFSKSFWVTIKVTRYTQAVSSG